MAILNSKYGILTYNSINIGDEIQSVAAMRFLPRIDEYIYRENIDSFVPKDEKSKIKLIMNAWWMWHPENFVPSKFIDPLCISMHIRPKIREEMFTIDVKEYLTKQSPIGCRDMDTYFWLTEKGIPAYFSGCLTLTLQRNYDIPRKDYILCVDVDDSLVEDIKKRTKRQVYSISRMLSPFYSSLQRFEVAKIMLRLYHDAALVISPRLHVILPSLALETPVLRILSDSMGEQSRYEGYEGFLNCIDVTKDNNVFDGYDFDNPLQNPQKHLEIRNNLIQKCSDFTGFNNKESLINNDIDPLILFMQLNKYEYSQVKRICYWASEENLKQIYKHKKRNLNQYDLVGNEVVKKHSRCTLIIKLYTYNILLKFLKKEDKRKRYLKKIAKIKRSLLVM